MIWVAICFFLLLVLVFPLILCAKIQVNPQDVKFALLFNGFKVQTFVYAWNTPQKSSETPQEAKPSTSETETSKPAETSPAGKAEAFLLQLMMLGALLAQIGTYIKGSRALLLFVLRLTIKSLQKLKVRFYVQSLTIGLQNPDVLGRICGFCSILQAWGLLKEYKPVFLKEQIEADFVWKIRLDLWRLLYLFLYFLIYMPWLPLWKVIGEHRKIKKQELSEKASLAL